MDVDEEPLTASEKSSASQRGNKTPGTKVTEASFTPRTRRFAKSAKQLVRARIALKDPFICRIEERDDFIWGVLGDLNVQKQYKETYARIVKDEDLGSKVCSFVRAFLLTITFN